MRNLAIRFGLAILCCSAFAVSPVKADPIIAGTTDLPGTAIQDLTIIGGTTFNPGSTFTIHGRYGVSTITLNRDAQVGDTIDIPTFASGQYSRTDCCSVWGRDRAGRRRTTQGNSGLKIHIISIV